jgi:hypothetical protein
LSFFFLLSIFLLIRSRLAQMVLFDFALFVFGLFYTISLRPLIVSTLYIEVAWFFDKLFKFKIYALLLLLNPGLVCNHFFNFAFVCGLIVILSKSLISLGVGRVRAHTISTVLYSVRSIAFFIKNSLKRISSSYIRNPVRLVKSFYNFKNEFSVFITSQT